jgi:hypothetical protein
MPTPVSALALGDIVKVAAGPYGTATVRQVYPDGSAQVWRPYIMVADFSYTGGVIPSIGLEDFRLFPGSTVELLRKGDPLK